ncbi:putative peptidylprolyl isomerase [Helianthus annuus]|nr:putative peptidylprolyl isomerase [Helianthus annuus]
MSSRTSTSLFGVIGAGVDQDVSSKDNPRVFMDISINGGLTERMIIELFANVVPRTAENFRVLCTGDKGIGPVTRKPLHYKGTVFHVIHKGFLAEGGDLLGKNDGSCGESIYGESFEDENFLLRHSEPGMLSMAKRGPNTNGSRFYLTFNPVQMLDGLHVVFGKVIEGTSTLRRIELLGTPGQVKITNCGQAFEDKGIRNIYWETPSSSEERVKEREKQSEYPPSEGLSDSVGETSQGTNKKSLKRASSSDGVKEHGDEREKQRKCSSSEGLLQISDCGEDKKNNPMESDQDPPLFRREHSRQQVGDDSVTGMLAELKQQSDWIMTSIREIAKAGDVHLPDYPLPL